MTNFGVEEITKMIIEKTNVDAHVHKWKQSVGLWLQASNCKIGTGCGVWTLLRIKKISVKNICLHKIFM